MTTATAAKKAQVALFDEFVELALVKLGVDYANDDDLKVIKKKDARQLASNVARLRRMADYDRTVPNAPEVGGIQGVKAQKSTGGNGARKAAAPRRAVPQDMIDFAANLLREVWASDLATGEELVADLGRYDYDHIDRMIANLKILIPISAGQIGFAKRLFAQKFGTTGAAEFAASLDQYSKAEAKAMLDAMQDLPDYVAPAPAAGEAPARRRNAPEVEADGMYRNPATGDIYKVQIAHHGSGNLYAKKLVKLDEPRIIRGKEAHFEFVMARGAIYNIKPEWQLDRADAKEFGDLYGCCMRCGLVLTDEASIDAGLGSTCIKKM